MAVTIKDVARRCGMSISTVSKVFNAYPDISEETQERVMQAAREIGYQPNALARALKTNRTYNLGVLFVDEQLSGLTHPFFAAVLNAFKAAVEERGYDITFISHHIGDTEMTFLEHCRYRNVDGVCLACVNFYAQEVIELVNSGIPCVTVDHIFSNRPCVLSDNRGGIATLVNYAVAHGHRRIAYIHGQRNSAVTENRVNSFYRVMASHQLPVPDGYVIESIYGRPGTVRDAVEALAQRPDRPTCIILPDDISASGAVSALRELGLRMPQDVSLAGYDGIDLMQAFYPRLTTIRQDTERLGTEAARLLIECVEHPKTIDLTPVVIGNTLIEGDTMANLQADAAM